MAIHESITQEAWTRIYWTMVLVEGILVAQRVARSVDNRVLVGEGSHYGAS